MLANARPILIAGAGRGVSGVALSGDADACVALTRAVLRAIASCGRLRDGRSDGWWRAGYSSG
jgi:hypothetical protein